MLCTINLWAAQKEIILATTTSVQETGFLDVLVEEFKKETGVVVKPIAVGTGQALEMGRRGDADILWVHSPEGEIKFVNEGYGINRITFLHNDFVLVGPKDDPAKIKEEKSTAEAFQKIAQNKSLFVSRADNSGTHKKENKIWQKSGTKPEKNFYIEAGQGMSATLRIANEKKAYTLSDRSTFLSLKKILDLEILSEGGPLLINYYSIILVNPEKFPKINYKMAKRFQEFLLSKRAKEIIENFGKDKFGQALFYYDYRKNDYND